MSLRDQFAREAMNGIVSNTEATDFAVCHRMDQIAYTPAAIAEYAYAIADAMLKEREKKDG